MLRGGMRMCPRLSLGSILPDGPCPGSLSSMALRFMGSEGEVRPRFREEVFFQENLCYLGVDERIRPQK